ncbi:MAG: hypothetical protein C5B48_02145 [Candidatus Rokuibacteriota bacterium]|nr:MAG: hypothetical protein C5B48_02145 [Candidatus Rokubacteria bacterium]
MNAVDRLTTGLIVLLPAAGVVYFGFNAGGYFPDSVGFAALVVAAGLVVRIASVDSPFAGFSRPLAVAAGGLGLFALWVLVSGRWSHAPARALVEFDRALLFLLALVLLGSLPRSSTNLRWALRGLAVAIFAVCVTGLATRLLPDTFPIASTVANNRLSYPLTYWNSLGLLGVLGAILCFHLSCSRSEPPLARALGAAAVPVLAVTVYFTFSRGAIAAGIVGLAAYLIAGRPRALATGMLATVPATVIAVVIAYHADLLATTDPTSSAATSQGHDVALGVALCAAAALIVRAALLWADPRVPGLRVPRRVLLGAGAVTVVLAVALTVALDVPGGIADQYDKFVNNKGGGGTAGDLRTRLTNPANNGRIDAWRVAYHTFRDAPFKGSGAGTYENDWLERRPTPSFVRDGHSLYLETLGELGIVGLVLLLVGLVPILLVSAVRSRGRDRAVYGVVFAMSLTWALRAGIDWDWEMPVVTLWVFAVGGIVLARGAREEPAEAPAPVLRWAAAGACVAIAIVPGLLLVSQTRLDDAANAFARGDCPAAVSDADSSIDALSNRPQPYEIRGYCRARDGDMRAAMGQFEEAVSHDPRNWTYHFDLALARGAAGFDPRAESAEAVRLNPLNAQARALQRGLNASSRRTWRRLARAVLQGGAPFYLSER